MAFFYQQAPSGYQAMCFNYLCSKISRILPKNRLNKFQDHFHRFKTREVSIGAIAMGGNNPIRIQSMTNTNTLDTQATVEQTIRLANAGCEYVRITAQGIKEAENLAVIKKKLHQQGCTIPLIADIHYNPKAAEVAARLVEKVRINPGNYTDRNSDKIHFSDAEYLEAKERIRENIAPLISICKQYGTALRIGSNHGSLSGRIMDRYGDTPAGMVEAALEFVEICEDFGFYNLVLSMKSSNPNIMVLANRFLVQRMLETGSVYPLHLGVTEAGEGEDGRIKSAAGIGALLAEGIGDTIRVSLTEAPEAEIPVARKLAGMALGFQNADPLNIRQSVASQVGYARRDTIQLEGIGGKTPPIVIGPETRQTLVADFYEKTEFPFRVLFLRAEDMTDAFLNNLRNDTNAAIVMHTDNPRALTSLRAGCIQLYAAGIRLPVIIHKQCCESNADSFITEAAAEIAPLFQEGYGNGIWLQNPSVSSESIISASFGILQAAGARISRTEYISCPSCGRTQYNIEMAVKNIRMKTSHLKGLTIGIMGCIVNGPGEMAGADYGYVGAGKGLVTLFKGKDAVKKNIPEDQAVQELINLIKAHGDWKEPG